MLEHRYEMYDVLLTPVKVLIYIFGRVIMEQCLPRCVWNSIVWPSIVICLNCKRYYSFVWVTLLCTSTVYQQILASLRHASVFIVIEQGGMQRVLAVFYRLILKSVYSLEGESIFCYFLESFCFLLRFHELPIEYFHFCLVFQVQLFDLGFVVHPQTFFVLFLRLKLLLKDPDTFEGICQLSLHILARLIWWCLLHEVLHNDFLG